MVQRTHTNTHKHTVVRKLKKRCMKRRQRGTDMRGLFVFEGSGRLFCNYNQCGFAKQTRHTSGVVQFVAERVIIHPSAELPLPLINIIFQTMCPPVKSLCLSLPLLAHSHQAAGHLGTKNCQSVARGGRRNESSFSLRFSKKPLSVSLSEQ